MSYLFLTTVAPSIFLIYYFFTSDKYREPIGTVLKITFYGVLICFPAVYGNQFAASILGWNIAAFTGDKGKVKVASNERIMRRCKTNTENDFGYS